MKKIFLLLVLVAVGFAFALPVQAAQKQGDKNFEVTGEVRFRGDYTDSVTDLTDSNPSNDDAGVIWPWRVRAGFHGNFTRNVSAHVEFQNFGHSGDGGNGVFSLSGSSGGNTELYQGWVELANIGGTTFDLRLGRQELVFGSEMLLGDLDFYNGIVHDGLRASWQYRNWTLDTWYTQVVENVGFATSLFPDSGKTEDTEFLGAYATFEGPEMIGFDAYAMVFNRNFDDFLGPTGIPMEERTTLGGRVYSKYDSNWSWFAEVAAQTGEFESLADLIPGGTVQNTLDISAVGFEGELAYEWRDSAIKPRIHGGLSLYTGNDGDPNDLEAFSAPFQDFHSRLGRMDLVRATNLEALQVGISWTLNEDRHQFGIDLFQFTLNEEIDSDPAAGVQGEDDLGTELDLYYNFAYSKHVSIEAAISSFQPGDLFDNAEAIVFPQSPGAVAPDVTAIGDDSAIRVYANTRLRW